MRVLFLSLLLAMLAPPAVRAQETPMPQPPVDQSETATKDISYCDARKTLDIFDKLTTVNEMGGPDCSYQQMVAGVAGGMPCQGMDNCLNAMIETVYFKGVPDAFESSTSYQLSATPVTPGTR